MENNTVENKNNKLLIVGIVIVALLIALRGFYPEIRNYYQAKKVLEQGVSASATIQKVEDTGNRFNENPEVILTVEVTPENGPSFVADIRQLISVVAVSQYQPGKIIPVKYIPETKEVAISE